MPIHACHHKPCGAAFPPDADRRRRYCSDRCRQAARRATRSAQKLPVSILHALDPVPMAGPPEGLAADVLGLWDALVGTLRADGLMVVGSAGTPVAHPLLRHFGALYAAAKDTTGTGPADDADDDDKVIAAAMRRVDAIQAAETARYGH